MGQGEAEEAGLEQERARSERATLAWADLKLPALLHRLQPSLPRWSHFCGRPSSWFCRVCPLPVVALNMTSFEPFQ